MSVRMNNTVDAPSPNGPAHATRYVGLDVHAATIAVAIAEPDGRVDALGTIPYRADAIRALITKLTTAGAPLAVCYEAGPCGYGLQRLLTKLGVPCDVIAPSLVPRRPGDRVKTDRRDALQLARFYRSGLLTPVWVPAELHEALRDLVRAREDALEDRMRTRHRLTKFLLRYELRRPTTRAWSTRHRKWLQELLTTHPLFADASTAAQARADTLLDYTSELDRLDDRLARVETAIRRAVALADPTTRALIAALQCLRGVAELIAITIVAELGRLSRFTKPTQLMGYAGLVSAEDSTGTAVRRGKITKSGNAHLRRVLVEAAWAYQHGPRVHAALRLRQTGQPETIKRIAWRAQQRLCRRYRRLLAKGKPSGKVVVAIARELLGFIWAIAQEIERTERAAGMAPPRGSIAA